MLKIKKTIVSEIDEGEIQELHKLEKSGDITHAEFITMVTDKLLSSTESKIDVTGTIKDNVKNAWDVVTDKDNFGKVLSIGTISALLFLCGDYHRTMTKIRKKHN